MFQTACFAKFKAKGARGDILAPVHVKRLFSWNGGDGHVKDSSKSLGGSDDPTDDTCLGCDLHLGFCFGLGAKWWSPVALSQPSSSVSASVVFWHLIVHRVLVM